MLKMTTLHDAKTLINAKAAERDRNLTVKENRDIMILAIAMLQVERYQKLTNAIQYQLQNMPKNPNSNTTSFTELITICHDGRDLLIEAETLAEAINETETILHILKLIN